MTEVTKRRGKLFESGTLFSACFGKALVFGDPADELVIVSNGHSVTLGALSEACGQSATMRPPLIALNRHRFLSRVFLVSLLFLSLYTTAAQALVNVIAHGSTRLLSVRTSKSAI